MQLLLVPFLCGLAAFVVAFMYQLALKRRLLLAVHYAGVFGLLIFAVTAFSGLMFGFPPLAERASAG